MTRCRSVFFSFSLCLICVAVFYQFRAIKVPKSFASVNDIRVATIKHATKQSSYTPAAVARFPPSDVRSARCTMNRCFDIARCRNGFKVYVYPSSGSNQPTSALYKKIVDAIRDSPFYTSDPAQACLFVPNIDVLDRDRLSQDYNKQLPSFSALAHWNGGKNHLIFGQYAGTWPDYADDVDFDPGQALLARASFSSLKYRPGFDVSIPLLAKDHAEKGPGSPVTGKTFPLNRKYLLSFRGKRYVHGVGSGTRNSLYHIHNGRDIIAVTTCRHGSNWEKFQDNRCSEDNNSYDKYDYQDLLVNSTFCLVPRGRRLGTFRLLEALQAGCIPVSLSNGYVLPFEEVINWKQAALSVDERQLLQVPSVVRSLLALSPCLVMDMRLQTQFLWETYFSSVQMVVMTTLKVIQNRIQRLSLFVWNTYPGGLAFHSDFSLRLSDFPFNTATHPTTPPRPPGYTLVIASSLLAANRTSALIRSIGTAPHLRKIIVLCSGQPVPAAVLGQDSTPHLIVVRTQEATHLDLWDAPDVETNAVLSITNNVSLTSDEVEMGYNLWLSSPELLVGLATSYRHTWDPTNQQWGYSYSKGSSSYFVTGAIFYHRYYGYIMKNHGTPQTASSNALCSDIALNVLVSRLTHKPPVHVIQKEGVITDLSARDCMPQ